MCVGPPSKDGARRRFRFSYFSFLTCFSLPFDHHLLLLKSFRQQGFRLHRMNEFPAEVGAQRRLQSDVTCKNTLLLHMIMVVIGTVITTIITTKINQSMSSHTPSNSHNKERRNHTTTVRSNKIEGTMFSGGEKMTVWVSDDANHIPLRIESPIVVGSVKVDMMQYRNLRYPLTSNLSFH